MSAESTLSTLIAGDGENIVVQDWPIDAGMPLRGVVLLVHGLGEHAGRYDHVARQLNAWGFAVRGYDQSGHGESPGLPGSLPTENRLLDDLADMVDSTRTRMQKQTPLILLGHSMGGLVVALIYGTPLKMEEKPGSYQEIPGFETMRILILQKREGLVFQII